MNQRIYYIGEASAALPYAATELVMRGMDVADTPGSQVTHLLLGVPCRLTGEQLRNLLKQVPPQIRVFGGFLDREELQGYKCVDLLQDEAYLCRNAAVTAHCALQIASQHLPVTFHNCSVLILGWGRIGKCLAPLLKALGAQVVIAVRNKSQQAMINALGYEAESLPLLECILPRFRVIFNTIPVPILNSEQLRYCRKDCLKVELASKNGIEGDDVLIARGLPGKLAPETSGKLIARTVLQLSTQEGVSL